MPSIGDITAGINVDARRGIQQVEHFGRAWNALKNNMMSGFVMGAGMGAFQTVIDGVREAFSAAGEAAFGFNSKLEQTEIAFTTLLGSAERTAGFIAELKQFSLTTPFEFPNLLETSQSLLSMGTAADMIIPRLTRIGDVASGLGRGQEGVDRITRALTQMQTKGKVSGDEILQLAEVGVPGYKLLADAIGRTVPQTIKLAEAGKISSDIFLEAFDRFADMRFGGMMANQARTMETALSNIRDGFTQAAARGAKPFFELVKSNALRLADFLQTERWDRWVRTAERAITLGVDLFERFQHATEGAMQSIAALIDQLSDLLGVETRESKAKTTGQSIGKAIADGIKSGIGDQDPTELMLEHIDRSMGLINYDISRAQFFQNDLNNSFELALKPLNDQLKALETARDWHAEIRDLQLEEEEATLRAKEARKKLNEESLGTITSTGRLKRGRDITSDLRLLEIEQERQQNSFRTKWREISQEMIKAPIQAQIDALLAAQQNALAPGNENIKQLERQAAWLALNKDYWTVIRQQAEAVAIAIKPATDAAKNYPQTPGAPMRQGPPIGPLISFEDIGKNVAKRFKDDFDQWFRDNSAEWNTTVDIIAYDLGNAFGKAFPSKLADIFNMDDSKTTWEALGATAFHSFAAGFYDAMKANLLSILQELLDWWKNANNTKGFARSLLDNTINPPGSGKSVGGSWDRNSSIAIKVDVHATEGISPEKIKEIENGVFRGLVAAGQTLERGGW